jgi:diguanylate cyclase
MLDQVMIDHDPGLVLLSVLIALQGAFAGLKLASSGGTGQPPSRFQVIAASLTLATGIWAMHFIGMLAARFPMQIDFLALPTLLSFLICALVVGLAVYAIQTPRRRLARVIIGGVVMGAGISAMHYVGMTALHASGLHLSHANGYVTLSVLIAIAGSCGALWLMQDDGETHRLGGAGLWTGALALALAICLMHYSAMAGMTLQAGAAMPVATPMLSSGVLALIVAVVAFLVSGLFLLLVMPDRALADVQNPEVAQAETVSTPQETPAAGLAHGPSPQGGIGNPPVRRLTHVPVSRDGQIRHVPTETIIAIHANAHYTHVHDGKGETFCQLSISALEAGLDRGQFMRVHRSHIVNLGFVVAVRKRGDEGVAEMQGDPSMQIPVARSKLTVLRSAIGRRRATGIKPVQITP